jgi:RHS repeat-associated protein
MHHLNHLTRTTRRDLRGVLTVLMVLGLAGTAAAQTAEVVEYYHLDALGSVRAVTNQSGTVVRTHDYRPFGEGENPAAGSEPTRFTGKERDAESGLDYFGARYYASRSARFTTADPAHVGGNIFDPQSWNAYAYARNNPLRYTDPSGTDYRISVDGGSDFRFEGSINDLKQFASGFVVYGTEWNGVIYNAAGAPVGQYNYCDPMACLLGMIGRTAAPVEYIAAGVTAFVGGAIIAEAAAATTPLTAMNLPAAVSISSLGLPVGMTRAAFAALIGWTAGGMLPQNLARTQQLIQQLPGRIEELRRAGVTAQMAQQWAQFYQAEAIRVASNPNALPRAQLMQAIADLLAGK